jgi:hypothetical protein
MSAPKHTPGPWKIHATPESSHQNFTVQQAGTTKTIATVMPWNEDEANAQLLAAAPLLAAELKWARDELSSMANRGMGSHHAIKRLDAALRAAGMTP